LGAEGKAIRARYINEIDIQEREDIQQAGYTVLNLRNREVQNNIQKRTSSYKAGSNRKIRLCELILFFVFCFQDILR